MTAAERSDDAFLVRLSGALAVIIPVAMLFGVGSLVIVSDVAVPRADPRAYLADLSAHQAWVNPAPWLIGLIPLLSSFMWLGFHAAFGALRGAAVRTAVLFGLMAAALELGVATLAGILVGYVAPAWGAAEAGLRPMIEAQFLLVQWGFDICLAAFDVFLGIAQVVAAVVMLSRRERLWTIVGWLGMASGILNAVGAFWFFAEPLLVLGAVGFFVGMAWVAGFGIGLLRFAPP